MTEITLRPGSHQRNMEDDVGAEWDAQVDKVTRAYCARLGSPWTVVRRRQTEALMLTLRELGLL